MRLTACAVVLAFFAPSVYAAEPDSDAPFEKRVFLSAESGAVTSFFIEDPTSGVRSRVVMSLDFEAHTHPFLYHPDACPSFIRCPSFLDDVEYLEKDKGDEDSEEEEDTPPIVTIPIGLTGGGRSYIPTGFVIRAESGRDRLHLSMKEVAGLMDFSRNSEFLRSANPPITIHRKRDELQLVNLAIHAGDMFKTFPIPLHAHTSNWLFPASLKIPSPQAETVFTLKLNVLFDPNTSITRMHRVSLTKLALAISPQSRPAGRFGQFYMPTHTVNPPTLRVGHQAIIKPDRFLLPCPQNEGWSYLNIDAARDEDDMSLDLLVVGADLLDAWLGVTFDPTNDQLVLIQKRTTSRILSPSPRLASLRPVIRNWLVPLVSANPVSSNPSSGQFQVRFPTGLSSQHRFLPVSVSLSEISFLDVTGGSNVEDDEYHILAQGNRVSVVSQMVNNNGLLVTFVDQHWPGGGFGVGRVGYASLLFSAGRVTLTIDSNPDQPAVPFTSYLNEPWVDYKTLGQEGEGGIDAVEEPLFDWDKYKLAMGMFDVEGEKQWKGEDVDTRRKGGVVQP